MTKAVDVRGQEKQAAEHENITATAMKTWSLEFSGVIHTQVYPKVESWCSPSGWAWWVLRGGEHLPDRLAFASCWAIELLLTDWLLQIARHIFLYNFASSVSTNYFALFTGVLVFLFVGWLTFFLLVWFGFVGFGFVGFFNLVWFISIFIYSYFSSHNTWPIGLLKFWSN